MAHTTKTQRSVFRAGLLIGLGLASLGIARTAHASSNYPPVLQQAIARQFPTAKAAQCVPLCTACHQTTAGGPQNLNKFGMSLENYNLLPGSTATIDPALAKLAAVDPDSDGDGTNDIEELQVGDSPGFAFPDGVDQWCPDIKYGCGAHIAAAPPPPVDRMGLFSAGLIVLGLAFARRRRSAARRPPVCK
jgi:hypothetical protein